ncbi:MAG: enoyl-CoA hydratase/isomerase family protein [Minwuiales bacterium]|nr:enoyl-CoA hydratase/isomerase family protein [Minwuiales bacterium]
MAYETLTYEKRGRACWITLNRPDALNAISQQVMDDLSAALDAAEADEDVWAAVLTGAGRAFCAGADLKDVLGILTGDDAEAIRAFMNNAYRMFRRVAQFEKPLIAAVDGYCLAGGMELALAADIRICSTDAQFGLPEITHGFFPGGGGPQRLARSIPQSMAMELVLTGDRIDAETALRVGIVSRMVPADALMPTTLKIAKRIAGHAPLAVKAAKEVTQTALDETFEQGMRLGGALRWVVGQTEDAREGPRAFAEKRAPDYKGR